MPQSLRPSEPRAQSCPGAGGHCLSRPAVRARSRTGQGLSSDTSGYAEQCPPLPNLGSTLDTLEGLCPCTHPGLTEFHLDPCVFSWGVLQPGGTCSSDGHLRDCSGRGGN